MSLTLPVPSGRAAATEPRPDAVAEHHDGAENEAGTRQRILQLVASAGPVSTADLAARLALTSAAIRRHVGVLEQAGQIAVHDSGSATGPARRGRPARRYVVTARGQAALTTSYSELAGQALRYVADALGPQAVAAFAAERVHDAERRYATAVEPAGPAVPDRVRALADALAADGYAASVRPVPGTSALQLCQGHCPVQQVAAEFPQLCEAEAQAFSRLLGVHVQRLSTLAAGGHVCTTNIPTTNIPLSISPAPAEGTTP